MKNFLFYTALFLFACFSSSYLRAEKAPEGFSPPNLGCSTFDNDLDGWVTDTATIQRSTAMPLNANDFYMRGSDMDGSSFLFNINANAPWTGDLSCTQICFDYNIESDGWPDTRAQNPSVTIFSGNNPNNAALRARFDLSTIAQIPVTENSGWAPFCVPLSNDNTIPPGWEMRAGTPAQWQQLIMNVGGLAFTTDVSPGNTAGEIIGVDNICVCPSNAAGVAAFQLEDVSGNVQNTFCEGETIIFNGLASVNESSYYIDVWKRPTGSNGPFTWLADQNVTGWVQGQVGTFDFTQLFLNDPDGAVVFGPECEYQVKLAIHNPSLCIPWTEFLLNFSINGLPVPEFHFEDADGNIRDVFCEGEEVFFNGIASLYESYHFIAITEISPNGTTDYLLDTGLIWEPADVTSLSELMDLNGLSFMAGYTYEIKLALGNSCLNWIEGFESFTVESLNSPWFGRPEFCREGDDVVVTLTAPNEHENHSWLIFLVEPGEPCVTNPLPGPIDITSGNQGANSTWSFTIPYVEGQCIVISHGTWSEACDWWEFSRAVQVPEMPTIEPNFTYTLSPIGNNAYQYNYSALPNNFPVQHQWAIERSNSLNGPWETAPLTTGLNTATPTAIQVVTRFYRITHRVASDGEEFCTRDQQRIIIFPQGEDGNHEVTDEEGNRIDVIEPERDGGSETGGEGDGGERDENGGRSPGIGEGISLFPNPANNQLFFKMSNEGFLQQAFQAQLMNATGQVVLQKTFEQETFNGAFDLSNLPNGFYQLRFQGEDGTQMSFKVMVQH